MPSIFQFLFRQLTHTAGNTSSSVFACCQNSTLSLFFRSEVYSFFRKSPRFLPALAGHILPAAFLPILKPEPRVPACRPLLQIYHTYLTYKSQPLTFGSAGQNHSNHQPFPQTPSRISRCLRATSFPRHFAVAFYSSNIPFFLFSFFYSFSLFFFLSSSPFLFIFSLHFLFSRLFLSSFLFSFSYPLFSFSFFISITMHVFRVHHPKGCKTERSSVSRSRGACPWRGFGAAPRILFFFSLCIALCMHAFCQAGRRILEKGGGCAYVKVYIKIT